MSALNAARTGNCIDELKIRARLRLRALAAGDPQITAHVQTIAAKRRWPMPSEWKLHHALNVVSVECGFRHWDHARCVLGGTAQSGDDFGEMWYADGCMLLLNHWCASYPDAKRLLEEKSGRYLFPYARQFVVGDEAFVRTLKLAPESDLWRAAQFDLAGAYGSTAWRELCVQRLAVCRPTLSQPIAGGEQ